MSIFSRKVKLIAHLGAHKTATSLVQSYFLTKQDYYLTQGLNFISRSDISPHISWGDRVIECPQGIQDCVSTAMKVRGVTSVLFSNENALGKPFRKAPGLYPEHDKIIAAFAKAFDSFDANIVYTIRPQYSFLESYYLQRIHQGDSLSFGDFIKGIDLDRLHWTPIVDALKREFGADRVTVIDFELIRQGQMRFIQEFVSRTISPDITVDTDYDSVKNPSISARGLEIALRVNPLLEKGEKGLMRKFLQANFSNQTEPRPVLMDDELRDNLIAKYQSEYRELVGSADA
ncbi:hypothetical protein [Loktanella sp. R86503]|uniref:hypothetical protein n=1 Tax=Loktanella sp. R86503 TaxID=3093847 RepID=UPI0036DD84E3